MSGVVFHFLNVGAGDCTIVHFPARVNKTTGKEKAERIMIIDFCHSEKHEEYEDIIKYYKENFKYGNGNPKPIFRFICTHPHHDHICGLHKLFSTKSGIKVRNFWHINSDFEPESFDGHDWHEDDRKTYKNPKEGNPSMTILNYTRDSKKAQFWNDDEDRITILSPSQKMIDDAHKDKDGDEKEKSQIDIDYLSYALLVEINKTKIILGGDSRINVREDIKDNFGEKIKDIDVFKAPHHGHYSAFEKKSGDESEFVEDIVAHMNPKYIIFSNSEEEDKEYGAEKEYKKACPKTQVLKTHEKGTIKLECDFEGGINIL